MAAILACELCLSEPRLTLPLRYATLIVVHTIIDRGWPVERVAQVRRMVSPSGQAVWGLGALGRRRPLLVVWGVQQHRSPTAP